MGGRAGRFDAEDSDLFGRACAPIPAGRSFELQSTDSPVLRLLLPKISAELPLAADALAGTGGKVSFSFFCPAETLDAVPGLLFSWRLFEYLIADTAIVVEMQMPSNNPRISCRRFTERNLCMGTSSPVAATSPAGASEALESAESSLLVRMPLDRIGERGLLGFGANLSASISPRAGNGALKTPEPSLPDRAGARCARASGATLAVASISPRDGSGALETLESSSLERAGGRCERAFETNLAIASGSLSTTLEGRPPAA